MLRLAFGRSAAPILVVVSIASSACSSSNKSSGGARPDRNVITQAQINEYHFANAFEAVQALHSNWLQAKVVDSFQNPSQVRVYVDNTSFGFVESLRNLSISNIKTIRYFDGVSATARWGIDHGGGVILVSTHQ
jgi:hypothetical protein